MGRISEKDTPISLEELLAKEGFKEKRPGMFARAFSQSQSVSVPLYPYRDQRKSKTLSSLKKTNRVKSDIPQSSLRAKLPPPTNRNKGKKPKSIRNKTIDEEQSEESKEKSDRVDKYLSDAQCLTVEPLEDFVDDDKAENTFDSSNTYKDIYSNEIYSHHTSEREIERERSMKSTKLSIQLEKSYNRSRTLAQRQNIEDDTNQRYSEIEQKSPEPSMDEAAIRAVISILNRYIKRFLSDGDFRTTFHHNCFASLNFTELEEGFISDSKVLSNLEQAIEVVEKAADESASERELKKASLQLSVITGLNSNEMKDGFTSGIPNSKLSACAHLYLSVVYKLQKKNKVAAQHLLQVFTNSPFQARTILLPKLWERMFLPHLVHLREWYNREIDSLGDTPSKGRKLKLLEKVYNEIIDSGTFQFAVYYKNWLSDGVEAPPIPSVNVPSSPFEGTKQVYEKGSSSVTFDVGNNHVGSLSPHPMVSRKLYDTMFGRLRKPEVDDVESSKKSGILSNIVTSSTDSSTAAMHTEQADERHDKSHSEEELVAKNVSTVHQDSGPVQGHVSKKFGKSLPSMVNAEANKLTLTRLANSLLAQTNTDEILNLIVASFPPHTADNVPYPNSYPSKMKSIAEEPDAKASIPKDFVCPLTGIIYEEPVTLETGHTFERKAIKEWLNQGNKTCPVSGKILECRSVPLTNFILKRIIDGWKSENQSKIQKEEAILFIRQLLTAFSQGRLKVSET